MRILCFLFAVTISLYASDSHWSLDTWPDKRLQALGGKAKLVKGARETCLQLDGKTTIQLPIAQRQQATPVTAAVWLNAYAADRGQQMIMAKNRYALDEREWGVMIDRDGRIKLYVWQGSWLVIDSGHKPKPGHWQHVLVRIGNNRADLWINGKQRQTAALKTPVPVTPAPVTLGGVNDNGRIWQNLFGAVDDARLYQRALSDTEAGALYQPVAAVHKIPQPSKPKAYRLWSGSPIPRDPKKIPFAEGIEHKTIYDASQEDYKFLHGAAIIHHKGLFYANWANSPKNENYPDETLQQRTFKDFDDPGTWSEMKIIGSDLPGDDRRSHAAYLEHKGQLWTFAARFGKGAEDKNKPDLFSDLQAEAFILNETSGAWESKGIVMKNCWPYEQPVLMGNGNYIVGGQDKAGKPVVAISHGDDLTKWDSVLIPYPPKMPIKFGETTVWAEGTEVTAVIRIRAGVAAVATSSDGGRTWTEARKSNMPMPASKAYLGKLSTGQRYLVSNYKDRNTLLVSVSKPGEKTLSATWRIRHGRSFTPNKGFAKSPQWSYPYAYEHDGKLYVVYSISKENCGLSVIPIKSLKTASVIPASEKSTRPPESQLWNPLRPFPKKNELVQVKDVKFHVIKHREPEVDGYSWLHGVALAWHDDNLFTFFGNNSGHENTPTEVARERRSADGGKTWGPVRMLAPNTQDRGRSHGAYLRHANRLWAFVGQIGNDAQGRKRGVVETIGFVLDEASDQWQPQGLVATDFWPVDEPTEMPDGNWIMGGMSDCVDGKAMPSVGISKGADFTKWQVVRIPLPEGARLWGETTVIVDVDHLVALVRNRGEVLASVSKDWGRTWSVCVPSGIKSSSTKVFAGKLSTGQRYAIGTLAAAPAEGGKTSPLNRDVLSIAVSKPGKDVFHSVFKIRDDVFSNGPGESAHRAALSYPYAVEHDGHLYVGYSNSGGRRGNKNSAELAIIPIASLAVPK